MLTPKGIKLKIHVLRVVREISELSVHSYLNLIQNCGNLKFLAAIKGGGVYAEDSTISIITRLQEQKKIS